MVPLFFEKVGWINILSSIQNRLVKEENSLAFQNVFNYHFLAFWRRSSIVSKKNLIIKVVPLVMTQTIQKGLL
jgi:hypothetical protein